MTKNSFLPILLACICKTTERIVPNPKSFWAYPVSVASNAVRVEVVRQLCRDAVDDRDENTLRRTESSAGQNHKVSICA